MASGIFLTAMSNNQQNSTKSYVSNSSMTDGRHADGTQTHCECRVLESVELLFLLSVRHQQCLHRWPTSVQCNHQMSPLHWRWPTEHLLSDVLLLLTYHAPNNQRAYRTLKVFFQDFPGPFCVCFPGLSTTIYVHFPYLSKTI